MFTKLMLWWRKQNEIERVVLVVFLGMALVPLVVALFLGSNLSDLLLNFGTEMLGAIIAFVLIQQFMEKGLQSQESIKQRVINQRIYRARLQNAISRAEKMVILEEMHIFDLLYDADFKNLNLQETGLWNGNFESTNMEGANLKDASLRNTNLSHTRFNTMSILPDGTLWKPDVDLKKFTDESHPDFWQPQWLTNKKVDYGDWEEAE